VHDPGQHAPGLNPALAETRFCPRCGAADPEVEYPRRLACPACGHHVFFNPKPVASTILRDPGTGAFWLLRRGFEPGAGRWTFPGGFVDLGETVEDAARREAVEEVGIDVELTGLVGVYSRNEDRVVLVVFAATPLGVPQTSSEAPEVRAFAPEAIPWDELAFWSTTAALRDALNGG